MTSLKLDRALLGRTNVPRRRYRHIEPRADVYWAPEALPGGPAGRVLLVFGAGGNNVEALRAFQGIAERVGAMVATVKHPRGDHDEWGHYYYSLQFLDRLRRNRLVARHARVVVAGFSGGGKMALVVGVFGGKRFAGVLAVGVNSDFASAAHGWLPNPSARSLPIVLLNGKTDLLVRPFAAGVLASMRTSGFRNVRAVPYSGGHEIPLKESVAALRRLFGDR